MPLAQIYTNCDLTSLQQGDLHDSAVQILADCLGKKVSSCMIMLEGSLSMSLGGDGSTCALIEVSGIDLMNGGANIEDLARRLGGRVAIVIGAPRERVFVKIEDVPRGMWGNGAKIFY